MLWDRKLLKLKLDKNSIREEYYRFMYDYGWKNSKW